VPGLLDGSYVAGTSWADASSVSVWRAWRSARASPARSGAEAQRLRRFAGVLPGLTLVALVAVQLRFILDDAPTFARFMLACAVALVARRCSSAAACSPARRSAT
jgi:hypothetical protein